MQARQNENAMALARALEKHPKVSRVIYPGLPSHPQHRLAKKQMSGFGGMVTIDVKGGTHRLTFISAAPAAKVWMDSLRKP